MEVIVLPRGAGKTKALIEKSIECDFYIVCHSHKEAYRVVQVAKELGHHIRFPLTYDEFLRKEYYQKGVKGFLIDNVDMLVQHLSPLVPIMAITATIDNPDNK